jgi:hypothetical protein
MVSGTPWHYLGYRPHTTWVATGSAAFLRRTLNGPPDEPSSSRVVWAVRRDWPIDGTHEFVCPRPDRRPAMRQLSRDRAFWRAGPIRPQLSVVRMSAHEFALHAKARRTCRAPDCAVANDAYR